jgi:hypothetical protein
MSDEEVHDEDDYEEEIISDEDIIENEVEDDDDDDEYDDDDEEEPVVEILESEFDLLEYRSKKLSFLESDGVENWEGYDNAMEDMANFEGDVDE